MTRNQHTLSICIPTFNRLHYLKESLDTLLPQAQHLGVDVCVSDNHSTDATVEYLKAMAVRFSCLHYKVQEENIGLEKNMVSAISMGKGDFILPIGDDELLPDGSLTLILNDINEDIDILILNGWHTDPYLVPRNEHLPIAIKGRSFLSPSEAFINVWHKMPPGSILAARAFFIPRYFDRFIGTSHAYTGALWDALAEKYRNTGKCTVKCMSAPTVLLRGGEKSWRADAGIIMLYEIPLWFSLLSKDKEYSTVIEPIRRKFLSQQTSLRSLLFYRSIDQLNNSTAAQLGKECTAWQQMKISLMVLVPKNLTPLLIGILNIASKIKNRVTVK